MLLTTPVHSPLLLCPQHHTLQPATVSTVISRTSYPQAIVVMEVHPVRELVVARYNESLTWLHSVPMDMAITIVNKGSLIPDPLPARATVISTANVPHARETGSYCLWLTQRYHSLPEYVYFTQARFDDHAPAFLDRLSEPPTNGYRGLTRRYNDVIPPPGLLPQDPFEERDEWFNAWTLDFLQFVDTPAPMYLKNLQGRLAPIRSRLG